SISHPSSFAVFRTEQDTCCTTAKKRLEMDLFTKHVLDHYCLFDYGPRYVLGCFGGVGAGKRKPLSWNGSGLDIGICIAPSARKEVRYDLDHCSHYRAWAWSHWLQVRNNG